MPVSNIKFADARKLTEAEIGNYKNMKKLELEHRSKVLSWVEDKVDLNGDGNDDLIGFVSEYIKVHKHWGSIVGVGVKGTKVDSNFFSSNPNFVTSKTIELRIGDIDKDGDLDIAYKTEAGDTYVFENITPKPEQ